MAPIKKFINDLAIFGGQHTFSEELHVGRPNIGKKEHLFKRISDMLDRKWFTNNGPYVQELEQRIAKLLGVRHCIAMCNGTVALEIATRAIGLKGEVIIPSFTFIATAHALQWQEITPVFCDIDFATYNVDPARVEQMITPRTTGIMGVHLWGRACNIDALEEIAQRHNLKLLFDGAHAFGCSYKGQMIGGFGSAEVFSFHATKFLNTFEGGAVVTNDEVLANKIRLMKNFGFSGYDNVIYIGTNGKMSEVSAAMGLTGLERLEEFIAINQCNYSQYKRDLTDVPGVRLLSYDEREKCNYQYIVLDIDEGITSITRDQLVEILRAENVLARRYFFPGCHNMEPYRSYWPHARLLLPNTERLAKRVMSLPTGTSIESDHVNRICEVIRFVIKHGQEVSKRLMKSDKAK